MLKLEKAVIFLLEQYPDILEQSCIEHNPSVIALYVFEVAKTFNSFYAGHSVTNAETAEKKTTAFTDVRHGSECIKKRDANFGDKGTGKNVKPSLALMH